MTGSGESLLDAEVRTSSRDWVTGLTASKVCGKGTSLAGSSLLSNSEGFKENRLINFDPILEGG